MPAPHPRSRRLLRSCVASIVLLLLAANLVAYYHARAMTHFVAEGTRKLRLEDVSLRDKAKTLFTGVKIARPINSSTPSDWGMEFETSRFAGDAGTLEAWTIPRHKAQGTALLFHGYADSKASLLEVAKLFSDHDWNVVMVDFRGSGGSAGMTTTVGVRESADVLATIRWAQQRFFDKAPVLYGFSMGAAAILRAVATEPVSARAIIVQASFDRLLTTVEHRFDMLRVPAFPMARLLLFWGGWQNDFDALSHAPAEYAAAVSLPTLVLHGAKDQRVTEKEARSIHHALRGPKSLHVFKSGDHSPIGKVPHEEWLQIVTAFLASTSATSSQ